MADIVVKAMHGKKVEVFTLSPHGDVHRIFLNDHLRGEIYFDSTAWVQISGEELSNQLIQSFGQVIDGQ